MLTSPRHQLIDLIEQGHIPPERIEPALSAGGIRPDGRRWLRFIDHLLLWLGGMALSCSLVFFIAYNWRDMGQFLKFGLVEALVVAAILGYCLLLPRHRVAADVALLMASICLGVLLALYGQTYQTGADPWQLFFTWALLMLPWTALGRFPALWVLWLALLNLSLVLYHQTFHGLFGILFSSDRALLWLLFALNSLALALWEGLLGRLDWLNERWAVRLLATASGATVTWLVIEAIFDERTTGAPAWLGWLVWLAAFYLIYRKLRLDLFMLAGMALSVIVVITCLLSKILFDADLEAGAFLFIAIAIIVMGTGAASWLRNVHREELS